MTVLGGINICIIPLIVLAADQTVKAQLVNTGHGDVFVHHSDEEKSQPKIDCILQHIEKAWNNRNVSVMLFASPQVLVDDSLPWLCFIPLWCQERLIKSLFIDELHLWLDYALSICQVFVTVSKKLFPHLFPSNHPERHVPLCAMTATFSQQRLKLFQRLTDVKFHQEDICGLPPRRCLSGRSILCYDMVLHCINHKYTISFSY